MTREGPGAALDAPAPAERETIYLHAGELVVTTRPSALTTVLGSCVSVCLWDPASGVGGMNHYQLALHVDRERSRRFGSVAIPELIESVILAGARQATLQAKVFGGAAQFGASTRGKSLGTANAELAVQLLAEARIPVLGGDVGGQRGRKLIFNTDDGSAWVRQL
jgi:chemotaxis protein CheD